MNKPHILLVEDEPHIASGLIYNLEEEGYLVTHVETGEAALQQSWPDDKFQLASCQWLRDGPGYPVFLLTLGADQWQPDDRYQPEQGKVSYLFPLTSLQVFRMLLFYLILEDQPS